MNTKTTTTRQGVFTLHRGDSAEAFHCDHCGKDKKAKISITWQTLDGSDKTICNGCYGQLLVREAGSK